MAAGIKLTYGYVKDYFTTQNCELLETDYKNARTKLRYKCSCGNQSSIVFDSFRRGNRCRFCGNKKSASKQKGDPVFVAEYFKSENCELLEEYKSARAPMKYRCNCGNISYINWNNFYSKGRRCKECGIAKRSGENHYDWREDRELAKLTDAFRQRCYKLLKMSLNATGRVKNNKTAALLGYDYKQLQEHITNHPNWEKVKGQKWHTDHIFPIKAFIDHGISDLKIINALDNLRPLAEKENLCKNAKYDEKDFLMYLKSKGIDYASSNNGI